MRGLSERSGEGGHSGNEVVPGTRAFRERELSGNEGVGEHVRTRFHGRAFGPVKLRVVRIPAPNEEKLVSSAGPVLKERSFRKNALPKYDPAV
jgi:hypothetical protein